MINAVRLVDGPPDGGTCPVPTFLLFSSDLAADFRLLQRFVPISNQARQGDRITIRWALPDPGLALGGVTISSAEAVVLSEQNQVCGAVRLMLVSEESHVRDTRIVQLERYLVDWTGSGGRSFTGSALQRARSCRQNSDYSDALAAAIEELQLAVRDGGLAYARHAAFALHEVGSLAEARGLIDAWEYFETLALMLYPNCHDALIGLALCAREVPAQALPFLGRAYAIRSNPEELQLYGRAFAHGELRPEVVREQIRAASGHADLDGQALPHLQPVMAADPENVMRYVKALARVV